MFSGSATMKPVSLSLISLIAGLCLLSSSCTTAKKEPAGTTLLHAFPSIEPVPEATVASLKAIANSPAAMPPNEAAKEEKRTETKEITSVTPEVGGREKWKSPGINTDEVNPGDIFGDNEGPVLQKSFSLADELPSGERRTLLNHVTTITTARVPMTFSRREIAELQSGAGANVPLPTRSFVLDYRSETRVLAPDRIETLLAHLSRGESGGVVESEQRQTRLKSQLASVRKKLLAGERLFMVTSITDSEKLTATYPGAPVGEKDVELVRNALQLRYPHLESIEAVKKDDSILITGSPRILWEFETREVKLQDDKIVIDSKPVVQL